MELLINGGMTPLQTMVYIHKHIEPAYYYYKLHTGVLRGSNAETLIFAYYFLSIRCNFIKKKSSNSNNNYIYTQIIIVNLKSW